MSRENPSLTIESLKATLTTFFDLAGDLPEKIEYRLLGTAAALLHGVRLPANDIDLIVRHRADVDAFGAVLAPFQCLVAPNWLRMRSSTMETTTSRELKLASATVEVDSDRDTIETYGPGPWQHYTNLSCGPYSSAYRGTRTPASYRTAQDSSRTVRADSPVSPRTWLQP
jgi:hypothetical protein